MNLAGDGRLFAARAAAWALLLAGWVGIGALGWPLAANVGQAFGLVASWLLVLGAVATIATRDGLSPTARRGVLLTCATVAVAALASVPHGGGLPALIVALLGWAALTAVASGVVRSLRQARPAPPWPPIGAAALGAVIAAAVLADPGDASALALRMIALAVCAALLLCGLQPSAAADPPGRRCRAGLFDCSLPAWPTGAWRDLEQWPALLAGLVMLPMMASLPLMVDWCRSQPVAPAAMVVLHLAAMFAPALLLRPLARSWSVWRLSIVCTASLVTGVVLAGVLPAPANLFALTLAHGAAWGLAWVGQLWSPARRGTQGSSPLRAAIGYAALTLLFGLAVDRFGMAAVVATHAVIALAACGAWLVSAWRIDPHGGARPAP